MLPLKLTAADPESERRLYKIVRCDTMADLPGLILSANVETGLCLMRTISTAKNRPTNTISARGAFVLWQRGDDHQRQAVCAAGRDPDTGMARPHGEHPLLGRGLLFGDGNDRAGKPIGHLPCAGRRAGAGNWAGRAGNPRRSAHAAVGSGKV